MTESSFAIVLVEGEGAAGHADDLQAHYGTLRAVTDADDLQNGDLLLLDEVPAEWNDALNRPWWAAINVLLLDGNRAPIVKRVALADALAEIG